MVVRIVGMVEEWFPRLEGWLVELKGGFGIIIIEDEEMVGMVEKVTS